MTQTKSNLPKSLKSEPEQAIAFLEKISATLKRERRNFDDAVVIHCIRLIRDYAAEDIREFDTGAH
jgi:hypothetical protein